ncbi:tyrosine-type recombinase/integrase [Kitasatospora sp. NPDC004240]
MPAGQEPREAPATWWQTEQPRELVLERTLALPFTAVSDANLRTRRRGLVKLLDWLQDQPGRTWQDRWLASGAEAAGREWTGLPLKWLADRQRARSYDRIDLCCGMIPLLGGQAVRPTYRWLLRQRPSQLLAHVRTATDPDGFARLAARYAQSWAIVEVLRHTGMRIEEALELTHHSFVAYRLPTTGEIVPMLQVAPSKLDQERLLLVSPELGEVLTAIIQRVRRGQPAMPAVSAYDTLERLWNAPMPFLFQRPVGPEDRAIPRNYVYTCLNDALAASGLTGPGDQPLHYTPHDFRRIFVTDALRSGLPPHIAARICGHQAIDTTLGYAAIYPEDVITHHRAFIARPRADAPASGDPHQPARPAPRGQGAGLAWRGRSDRGQPRRCRTEAHRDARRCRAAHHRPPRHAQLPQQCRTS